LTDCKGVCTDLSSDPDHCKHCNTACSPDPNGHGDAVCDDGVCGVVCASGYFWDGQECTMVCGAGYYYGSGVYDYVDAGVVESCYPGCLITMTLADGGTYQVTYTPGTVNPVNGCLVCDPANDPGGWSPAPAGTTGADCYGDGCSCDGDGQCGCMG
jgi:hypothetical protein